MPEGTTLPGRSGVDALFADCIRRPADGSTRDLPVIVLLGMRGSGKTWVLEYLKGACQRSDSIPYVFADCAAQSNRSVWELNCKLTDALHAVRWPGFGRLNFPRVTLGRLAVEDQKLAENLTQAQEELRAKLRAPFRRHVDPIVGLATNVLQVFRAPQFMISAVVWAVRLIAGSNRAVERLYRTGLQWYGVQFGPSANSGLSVLVELNHRFQRNDHLTERMLLEAFLEDLNDAFARNRSFNCAIFLDNCDDQVGAGFLNLLADLRSGRSGRAPLVVVAASRTVPELTDLDRGWTFRWEPDQPRVPRVPDSDQVGYSSWQDNRARGDDLASWWCPVYLRDLTEGELDQDFERRRLNHREFVYRLTGGHPWSTHRVQKLVPSGVLGASLSESELRNLPAEFAKREAAEYLLSDLPPALRNNLVSWSAARDIDIAAAALGEGAGGLRAELEKRLWLVPPDTLLPKPTSTAPRLHPWLRRILLRELAADQARWPQVHCMLHDYATRTNRPLDAAYHELACDELRPAVDYLAGLFDWMDTDSWIRIFNAITDAPARDSTEIPVERHERLVFARGELDDGPLDQTARIRKTLWSLVAARWIWSGQLGDPKVSLKDTIADGFARLADESPAGSARYRREARIHRETRPW